MLLMLKVMRMKKMKMTMMMTIMMRMVVMMMMMMMRMMMMMLVMMMLTLFTVGLSRASLLLGNRAHQPRPEGRCCSGAPLPLPPEGRCLSTLVFSRLRWPHVFFLMCTLSAQSSACALVQPTDHNHFAGLKCSAFKSPPKRMSEPRRTREAAV